MSMKRVGLSIMLLLCTILLLSACGGDSGNGSQTANGGNNGGNTTETPKEEQNEPPAQKSDINFYGKIVEFTSGEPMVAALQDKLKDKYNINGIQVDWANLEKVVKTGIASGKPADVYQFWPQQMTTFVENNQALDLTPYLEANDGEWLKTLNPALMEIGKYDGKYYNVPLSSNFSVMYINKNIFADAGIEVPDQWTWEEFMAAGKQIQEKTGVHPFAIGKDLQAWLYRNGLLSLAKTEDKLEDLAAGNIPANDPIYVKPLQNIKQIYDEKMWYPGEGAISTSRDEAQAAFYQGKAAMLGEVATNATSIVEGAGNFEVAVVLWPSMGTENAFLGGADGLFIPANVKNPDASVEVLKTYLSEDIQKIHAAEGYATANLNVEVSDPVITNVMQNAVYIYPKEITQLSPRLNDYIEKEAIPAYVLSGATDQEVEKQFEKFISDAKK
ncbi:ABC transporter substrate-binding protein [Paenibacillus lemnae]|uniref:Extracellular solute-binding protein n=1 Tax=Paenibacillus lemnae TaxID=1330551 RepID=A0A848M9E5_PAELE|nr:extracellular solute-binding protein [Paenibacillus lemnae]NMO97677.1 extracellular solute-binding protein [Paenibacillus lemnae]